MKPIRFSKFLGHSRTLRAFRLALAAPALVLTLASAQAGTATPAAAAPAAPTSNWVSFTIGGAFVSGDDAGMMRRTQTNGDFYGGIESMQFSQALDNTTTLTLDGHALPGLEDYEINVDLTKADVGYVKAGWKQYRTWYDASGGWLAAAPTQWRQPFDDERTLDRGEAYLEAGLRMENLPEVTFRYSHAYRNGDKDSSCWGDVVVGSGVTQYKLVPALWNIDETTDLFELDVEHTLGNTDLGLGLVYEHVNLDNSRYTPRGLNKVTLKDSNEMDLFASNIHSVTRFSEDAWLSFAAAYNTMDTDIDGGTRSYAYGVGQLPGSRDYSYDKMVGGSNVQQVITNLNFMWVPMADLTVTPSLRYEYESTDTISQFRAYNSTSWLGLQQLGASTDKDALTGALDLRYNGIDNVVLYAKGQWGQENEDIFRQDIELPGEFLATDVTIDEQEYVLGANWYAMSHLSFGLQGFYSERDQALDHYESNQSEVTAADPGGANNLRPIMTEHDVQTSDVNFRMTWRPLGNLSLITRYDYRNTEFDNQGISWTAPSLPTIFAMVESGTVTSRILSESVTWSPMARMYVQGTASWVSSETETPCSATTPDSDNDYLTATLAVGYAIDDRTDITASYSYYGANNYNQVTSSPASLGYGLETQESVASVTLNRVLTENMVWNLRYAYIDSNTTSSDQSGGFDDFTAHMVSTGLQIRF